KPATPPQPSSSDEEEQSELGGSKEDISDVEGYERKVLQMKALGDVKAFQVGDFVLVKFYTTTSTMYYVGLVISKEDDEFLLKFLRRHGTTWKFVYPPVENISSVREQDIILKLPFPKNVGGTERVKSTLTFGLDLRCYENVRRFSLLSLFFLIDIFRC
ncbi:unnamed protein product, partial [Acanthoscelides obtectus]